VHASLAVVLLLLLAQATLPAVRAELDADSDAGEEADSEFEDEAEAAEESLTDSAAGEQFELEEEDVAGEQEQEIEQQHMQEQEQPQQQQQQAADTDLGVEQEQSQAEAVQEGEAAPRSPDPWTAEGKVLEVGDSRVDEEGIAAFTDVVGKHIPALVEFYIPTCGHCQGFAPEYERLAKVFKGQPVLIARVNAHRWGKLADQYHVSRVPDIRYFPKSSLEPQEYRRPRAIEDITLFLNDYAGTNVEMKFQQIHTLSAQMEKRRKQGYCPLH